MQPASASDRDPVTDPVTADTQEGKPTVIVTDRTNSPRLFKLTRTFTWEIPHPDFPSGKPCKVRFPTDEEWCRRQRKIIDITKSLGRDAATTDTKGEEDANLQLFNNIRLDKDGPEFDEYEAGVVIQQLAIRTITDVKRLASAFQITMDVPGAEVVHILKIPTQKQIMKYYASAVPPSITRRSGRETRVLLEPSGDLWGELIAEVTGYVDNTTAGVTILHKDAALTQMLFQVQSEVKGGPDPEG